MNKNNEGATINTILIPDNGSITLMNESGQKLTISGKRFHLLHELLGGSHCNQMRMNLMEGFVEIMRYKIVMDSQANELWMTKDFITDFSIMLEMFKSWDEQDEGE